MTGAEPRPPDAQPGRRWADALLAAELLAKVPADFGGIAVKARAGPVRERWLRHLRAALPANVPLRKLPIGADRDRLLGGIDLSGTLETGRPVMQAGLLAEARGGILLAPMAERMAPDIASLVAQQMDTGDGAALVALDEGDGDDGIGPALAERCAFLIDLDGLSIRDAEGEAFQIEAGAPLQEDPLAAICGAAAALGIYSARAPLFALRAARLLADGDAISEAHLAAAARLVLAGRATALPPLPDDEAETGEPETSPEKPAHESSGDPQRLEDSIVEAVRTQLPEDIALRAAARASRRGRAGQGQGERKAGKLRGRPAGIRPGIPGQDGRLSLIDTLRAAVPWQALRRRGGHDGTRVSLRKEDLRVRRFEERAETTTIFVVDASGSAAAERLAEAKGAAETLLARAYVDRAQVALIAFSGTSADLLLPPTRSLTRARRQLAALPGGGGTPLAAGIGAAVTLALGERRRGRTPFIVLLTDGRGNVALSGEGGRALAAKEADAAADRLRAEGLDAALVDISARGRAEASALADRMGAAYIALPRRDAGTLGAAVRAHAA